MSELHSLLKRQLRRVFGGEDKAPPDMQKFIDAVNNAYREFDRDREMIELSMELSSQELLQANSDLGAVLETVLDLFFHIDRDGVILAYRVGTASDLVVSADTFIGKRIQDVPFGHVGRKFEQAIDEVHQAEELVFFEYVLSVDEEKRYEARLLPLRNDEIAVIIRNVTEYHNIHEREKKLQARLTRSERMESLGVLAGGVAHDLNNILGPLVAYPELIREILPADSGVSDLLEQIEKSADRAVAVIQDLLTLARRGNFVLQPTDVNALIHEYVESVAFKQLLAEHPNCGLNLSLKDDLPLALGTPHHLNQAIMNLVMNAFEAVADVGCVSVSTKCEYVEERSGIYEKIMKGHYVNIRIHDTGTGIRAEDVEHIFEPFYTKKKMGRSGSGLGLAVVYGVVKDMKGHIDVETKIGEGTAMTLYIPVTEEPAEESEDIPFDCSGHERILVVDDMFEQRMLAERVLSGLGYAVETAGNGHEAIEKLREQSVELVLMDMIMEDDFDGLDAYKEILKIHPEQKCVIVSGFAETDRAHAALEAGAGAFLQKPYTPADLSKTVRKELNRNQPA